MPFVAPPGIRWSRVDRASGRIVFGTFPVQEDPKSAVIWEAFQPETEPRRSFRREDRAHTQDQQVAARRPVTKRAVQPAPQTEDFLQRQGGIY